MGNEADFRARLTEPKLKTAGWTNQHLTRESYYNRDHQYTPGLIILVGDGIRRVRPKRVDYLLRYTDGFSIAVVEAKSEDEEAESEGWELYTGRGHVRRILEIALQNPQSQKESENLINYLGSRGFLELLNTLERRSNEEK